MLSISSLYKRFGDKEVLCGLDLHVPQHSIFGFIGKNGSGKTTTMKAVLGLIRADSGEILVNGEPVVFGQSATNRHVGYLPDVPEFYSFMSAREYLKFCSEISKIAPVNAQKRIDELLEIVGLSNERHRINGFSRGMKQRLGIAQALLNKPKLLICDEPTSALDPTGRKELLDILSAVKEETTVLFSTHILSDVERICTDVALLDGGIARISGSISEIKERYRSCEYSLEAEACESILSLKETFPKVKQSGENKVIFGEKDYPLADVLHFVAAKQIPLLKLERLEPTLEDLFVEVTEK